MAESFRFCVYILCGFILVLFIRSQNQSKKQYLDFVDDLNSINESIKQKTPDNQSQTISTITRPTLELTPTNKTCNALLTLGSWKKFKITENPESLPKTQYNETSTFFRHNSKYTKLANLYKPKEIYNFTYSGGFKNPNCEIHVYKTTEIKQCFDDYHEIVIFGDSRSRVLYRVLKGRYDGVNKVTDYKDHKKIIKPPFIFYWSVDLKATVNTLMGKHLKNVKKNEDMKKSESAGRSNGKRLVIIGEQLQWPSLAHLKRPKTRKCSQETARSNMQPYLYYAKLLIQQLEQFDDTEFLFVSAESRYDYMKWACCSKWNAEEWDSLSKFYTDSIRDLLKEFKPKNAMLMETNRITMEYEFDEEKTRQHLMPDGVHKMARSPNSVPKEFAPIWSSIVM